MIAARFDPPSGYPCDVTVTIDDPAGGEPQRAEFPHAQLEQWGEGAGWSDEDYQARMLETMAQERVRSSDPFAAPPVDET
jgi:hypothetical protein